MRGPTSTLKLAILCFKKDIAKLEGLKEFLENFYEVEFLTYSSDVWSKLHEYDCVIAYLAAGIVVRGVCGRLRSKWEDPAVLVLDKPLKHAVVLLGAHRGGNEVATKLEELGIKPVLTTAMEFSEGYSVGVGFRRDVGAEDIMDAISRALEEIGADFSEVRAIATIGAKRGSVIVEVANRLKKPLVFVDSEEINSMDVRTTKATVLGVKNVAEACAIYASRYGELVLPKRVYGGVTVAIAR
ncbi:MAG: cobalamin biosynthesis protein [Archaeoglobaceae archaeon]